MIGAAIGAAISLIGMISNRAKEKKAQEALDNYKRQHLQNPYLGLQVSTAGADLAAKQLANATAAGIDQLAAGGARSLNMALPNLIAQQNQQQQQISADLDAQYKQIQQLQAQGQVQIQQMQEQREYQDLAGLGQQISVAQQNAAQNLNGLFASALSLTQNNENAIKNRIAGLFGNRRDIAIPAPINYLNVPGVVLPDTTPQVSIPTLYQLQL